MNLPDWGRAAPVHRTTPRVAACASGAGLAAGLAAWLAGAGAAVAALAALATAGALALWVAAQGRLALRAAGARAPRPGEAGRMANLLEGLAPRLGVPAPRLLVVDSGGPNVLVCRAGGACVAVTRALLEHYNRTEQEAVAAQCLVRLATGAAVRAQARAALGPLAGPGGDPAEADVVAAAVTRYPPALASALSRAEPRAGRYARLWMVPAGAAERVEALADL